MMLKKHISRANYIQPAIEVVKNRKLFFQEEDYEHHPLPSEIPKVRINMHQNIFILFKPTLNLES